MGGAQGAHERHHCRPLRSADPSSARAGAASIRYLIERRLARAYEENGVKPPYPAYPFGESFFEDRIGWLPREVLKACREHQLACVAAGRVTETGQGPTHIVTDDVQHLFGELVASADVSDMLKRQDEEALDKLIEVACEALIEENPLPKHMDALIDKDFAGTGSFEPLHARLRVVDHSAGDRERHYAFRFLEKTHHIAFQSRLKAAMTSAGIDHELEFRRLKILRAAPRPTGALSVTLISELEQRGGKIIPRTSELKVLAALHRLLGRRDHYPPKLPRGFARRGRSRASSCSVMWSNFSSLLAPLLLDQHLRNRSQR